jgi:hypothetical protein
VHSFIDSLVCQIAELPSSKKVCDFIHYVDLTEFGNDIGSVLSISQINWKTDTDKTVKADNMSEKRTSKWAKLMYHKMMQQIIQKR